MGKCLVWRGWIGGHNFGVFWVEGPPFGLETPNLGLFWRSVVGGAPKLGRCWVGNPLFLSGFCFKVDDP